MESCCRREPYAHRAPADTARARHAAVSRSAHSSELLDLNCSRGPTMIIMNTTDQNPIIEDNSVDHAEDRLAIEALIAKVETAFNTNDAELMVRDVARNAVLGNAAGMLLHGRDATLAASRDGLAGFLKDQYVRYELIGITFLRADVAIAHKA